jgi:hypothetical protein
VFVFQVVHRAYRHNFRTLSLHLCAGGNGAALLQCARSEGQ